MDFLMESGLMHWMSERMSFTNWVKADFHEASLITLKFSAPPRLRERYRLGAGTRFNTYMSSNDSGKHLRASLAFCGCFSKKRDVLPSRTARSIAVRARLIS